MQKENYAQLELFSQAKGGVPLPEGRGSFLSFIRAYERVMLVAIGFIVTGIVAFSLGVENGRRMAASAVPVPAARQPVVRPQTQNPPQQKATGASYTIQLASFQSRTGLQREVDTLKKKGIAPVLFSDGKKVLVCVGTFTNKATAQTVLAELKKHYRDCFIRRL